MELRFWAATDVGRVRDHNEDNFLVDERLQLFVVCDGMGGHAAGEVASAICVRTVREVVAAEAQLLLRLREHPEDRTAAAKLEHLLERAVKTANARIFQAAQKDASRRGMGTTCVAVIVAGDRGYVGHVGDSRLYRLRAGKVEQITDDHSLLNEMIRQGKVAPGTSEDNFPHKNAVTRAVGVRESVDVDAFRFEVESGDRLLICSDGLSEYLGDSNELVEMLRGDEPRKVAERFVNYANRAGGKDNITVAIIDRLSSDQAAQREAEREQVIEILKNTPYFHYLAPAELEEIRKLSIQSHFEADSCIIDVEEDNDSLFVILKGSVSLQLDGEQVSVLTTGEHFGEMALIDAQDEKDFNLVARTLEPTSVLAIERDHFVKLLRTAPALALKLLWNFVQVFAERLQTVPREYRFTPDEWRGDPEAISDVTPPSGQLVFEEDRDRIRQTMASGDVTLELSNLEDGPPSSAVAHRAAVTTSTDLPPLEEEDHHDASTQPKTAAFEAVQPRRDADSQSPPRWGSSSGDKGISSGTYDQSVLEAGVEEMAEDDGGEESPPTVTFNRNARQDRASESELETSEDDDLRKTMKLDWNNSGAPAMKGPPELPDQAGGVGSARGNSRRSESMRRPSSSGGTNRTGPSQEVLDKAHKNAPNPGEHARQRGKSVQGEESTTRKESEQGGREESEPRIMISPDLMAGVEDHEE